MTPDLGPEAPRPEQLTRDAIVELLGLVQVLDGVEDFANADLPAYQHLWVSPRRTSSRLTVLLGATPWNESRTIDQIDALEQDYSGQYEEARTELSKAWGAPEDLPADGATILASQWRERGVVKLLRLTSEMHEMPFFLQVDLYQQ
jgi:hypothetical protein